MSLNIANEAAAYLTANNFRGAVLLAREEEILLRSGFGMANEEWGIPNSPETRFRIGSATKMFTAAAVLRLYEKRLIDLHAEIGSVLDALPEAWQPLTPHQLLSHTSGLADHIAVPEKQRMNLTGASPRELVNLIAEKPLLSSPGAEFHYSNSGYFLLGMLLEKVSGKSYEAVLDEEIIRPLGLRDTSYDYNLKIVPNRASGYMLRGGTLMNAQYLDMIVPYAAGGLISTIDDMLRWNQALHTEQFLKPATYTQMTTTYMPMPTGEDWGGYGIFVKKRLEVNCLWHTGAVNGFLSAVQFYPQQKVSLIVLSNLMHPMAFQPVIEKLSGLITGVS